jgi:hypothetical protein
MNIEDYNEERTRCEIWTRIMGYYRPKNFANTGKQGEFAERRFYTEGAINASIDKFPDPEIESAPEEAKDLDFKFNY